MSHRAPPASRGAPAVSWGALPVSRGMPRVTQGAPRVSRGASRVPGGASRVKRLHDHESLLGTALEPPGGGARRVGALDRFETNVVVLLR